MDQEDLLQAVHRAAVPHLEDREARRDLEEAPAHHPHQRAAVQQPAQVSRLPTAEAIMAVVPPSPTQQARAPHPGSHPSSSSPQVHSPSSLLSGSMASTATPMCTLTPSTTRPRTRTRPSLSTVCARSIASAAVMRMAITRSWISWWGMGVMTR